MSGADESADRAVLSPEEAFAVLGNETRMSILQALADAEEPVSFTALRERLGIRQGGQFNYHLEQVVGHFVGKTEAGYVLRQPGRRVVQAVQAGTITEDPELDYVELDEPCWLCGSPIGISFHQERLDMYCTGCDGTYRSPSDRWPTGVPVSEAEVPADVEFHGTLFLPAGGLVGRDPPDAYRAGMTWEMLENLAISNDICPRCAGPIESAVAVCEDHDATDGLCDACDNLYAVLHETACRNCLYRAQGTFVHRLYGKRELLEFLATNGSSPLSIDEDVHPFEVISGYEEDVVSIEPFEARFTFSVDDRRLTVTVDDDYAIVDATVE